MGGIEAPHHHLFEPVEGGALRASPPVGVEEGDGVQLDAGLVVVERGRDGEHVQVEGAMREGDALGSAGGSRGIKQLGDFVFVEAEDVGPLDAPARQQCLVSVAGFHPALHARAGLPQLVHQGGEVGLINHHAGFGVIEDARQLHGGEAHVERHGDGADERCSEVAFQQLMGIEAQIGHAIAGEDSLGEQSEGHAFDTFAELGVGEAPVTRDHAGLFPKEVYCAVERSNWCKGHVHVLEIVSGDRGGHGRSFSHRRRPHPQQSAAC